MPFQRTRDADVISEDAAPASYKIQAMIATYARRYAQLAQRICIPAAGDENHASGSSAGVSRIYRRFPIAAFQLHSLAKLPAARCYKPRTLKMSYLRPTEEIS